MAQVRVTRDKDNECTKSGFAMTLEMGEKLFNSILMSAHQNNIDEMHTFISNNVANLSLYGSTKEKQLLNYCSFKRDLVLRMYGALK